MAVTGFQSYFRYQFIDLLLQTCSTFEVSNKNDCNGSKRHIKRHVTNVTSLFVPEYYYQFDVNFKFKKIKIPRNVLESI